MRVRMHIRTVHVLRLEDTSAHAHALCHVACTLPVQSGLLDFKMAVSEQSVSCLASNSKRSLSFAVF